ncbi:LacI family DNA-binding transcriptional regulator [Achromobacter sp. MY14]|uniref:LacI family DNA-binding transcriptional regulator n=1 Tax=unclassified Achromobacter TaxID=2626865 RepID=UPI001E50FD33|nr:LacI family DNA-binding transcriptional regulator [Achromobacter sp. MY14]MCD0500302.1 LacI family DNA-binding transcriptional regulator [Achromobacter sp. MY14]
MRPTISLIAREAGMSTATVDRVLNDRDGVRGKTRDRVLAIANRLGYFVQGADAASQDVRVDFVLPAGTNSFMTALGRHLLEEAATRPDVRARLHLIEGFDANKLAQKLYELREQTQAVGLVGLDHPQVRDAIMALRDSGVHVSTLVSDIPISARLGYVGIDNRAAGRLAALLLGRFLPQHTERKVAVFVGSLAYRGHEEREMGFRSLLSEEFPHLRIAHILEIGDDRDRAFAVTQDLLRKDPPHAIYNIGAGNQGIARALKEARPAEAWADEASSSKAASAHRIVFVGHDLTEATRRLLLDRTMDAVIDQNPRVEAREIVKLLVAAVKGAPEPSYLPRLQVIFRENIPEP